MRLIDADKLKMSFKPYFDGKKTIGQIIDEQPTVEEQPTEECEENGSPWCLGHCPYNTDAQPTDKCKGCYYNDGETHAECVVCDKEEQPTSDDEIIKALKAVRTIHNGNYAPQIDEAIRRLEAQPTDAEREAYIKGYDYGVKDWFKSKTQPCEDCISREAVEKLKKYSLSYDTNTTVPKTDIFVKIADIKHLPPVTPQRPRGKWIELKNKRGTTIALRCSICKKSPIRGIRSDFCPNCGSYNGGETNDK